MGLGILSRLSFVALASVLFGLVAATPVVVAADLAPPSENFIDIDSVHNTISVKLVNTDIQDVAKALARQGKMEVFLDDTLKVPMTVKFANMPLELGIKRLLGPISSSFIFVEDKDKDGQPFFRIEKVKIFRQGNMLRANYKTFAGEASGRGAGGKGADGKGVAGKGAAGRTGAAGSAVDKLKRSPRTPGALRHAIVEAQKNLSLLRKKAKAELAHVDRSIADIKRQLSQNPTPQERKQLVLALDSAEKQQIRVSNLNSRLIIEEEKNVRELVQERTKVLTPEQLGQRSKGVDQQKRAVQQRKSATTTTSTTTTSQRHGHW